MRECLGVRSTLSVSQVSSEGVFGCTFYSVSQVTGEGVFGCTFYTLC